VNQVVITKRAISPEETQDTLLVVTNSAGVPKYEKGLYYWFNNKWSSIVPLIASEIFAYVQRKLNVIIPDQTINYTTLPAFTTVKDQGRYQLTNMPIGYTVDFPMVSGIGLTNSPKKTWSYVDDSKTLSLLGNVQGGQEMRIFITKIVPGATPLT